ncbi:hypothetical protein BDM02DRAFT_3087388 [Thelephora ganbajun]|uniref:Uncharacterized protein n=1 Tax=Thelephora ganbajun TaxID=370292 RepID=A0ACB6ZTZ9_THEGA|nr:hypothetical protein BDM02DRAFT_3087388 [Thelephora ganbajun]
MSAHSWNTLPTELKLHTIGFLRLESVKTLSEVSYETYALCVPSLFRSVTLNSCEALSSFMRHVPKPYYHHIRSLSLCLKPSLASSSPIDQTSALIDILTWATRVESLSLHFIGSPAKCIIPSFQNLHDLRSLYMSNCGDENSQPLSERLVVSIALAIPQLQELTLDKITRSQIHAPDLLGTRIPIVIGDNDIEDHPIVGSALSLPSLLQIPTLQQLRIRDTHLGDCWWKSATCLAPLSVLDLGSCCHVSPEVGRTHVEAIVRNVASTSPVNRLAIATGLEQTEFRHLTTPLKSLRHLELTSFFPVDSIADTLSTLSGSPIETVAVQCFNDDVEDLCESLETFLNERVERGPGQFHQQLKKLFITLVPLEGDEETAGLSSAQLYEALEEQQRDAIKKLEDFCRDLGLECGVLGISVSGSCCASAVGFGGLRHTSVRTSAEEAVPISKALTSSCL